MRLKDLVKPLKNITIKGTSNPVITGISSHSKGIKPGELYVAYKGLSFDGRDFIDEAIKAHAAGVITDIYNPLLDKKFIQIITKDPLALAKELALNFYDRVDHLIGITGTNGKTTVAFCIAQLLNAVSFPCALSSTCYCDSLKNIFESHLTIPDGIFFSKLIHESKHAGAKALVAEVSSHALDQKRLYGHKFDTVIFTNLTHDHLDYHESFEAYGDAKLKLFLNEYQNPKTGWAILNLDDPFSKTIKEKTRRQTLTYSLKDPSADFYLSDLKIQKEGISATLHHLGKTYPLMSSLIGDYNASNLLAAIACAVIYTQDLQRVLSKLEAISGAPGRLEKVSDNVFIDYAHTPDGLESVLKTVKKLPFKKVRLVFGCGGDRDKLKRPLMAEVAQKYADEIIITSDNPRHEDPETIIEDIKKGFTDCLNVKTIADRKKALGIATADLNDDTLLLVAGKGHEKTQTIGSQKLSFDEHLILKEELQKITSAAK